MIDKFDIEKLRALPIEGVAQRLGLHPVRHLSLCPFHDDRHPSLHFNVSRNTYTIATPLSSASRGLVNVTGSPFMEIVPLSLV